MNRRAHLRGFTLIEALCAIAVIAIVIPVILQGFNIAANIAGLTRQTADATMLAQSTMDELISNDTWQTSSGPGSQMIGPTVYDVEVLVDQWDGEANVSQLTVKVHWGHRGPREVSLTTIVYIPDSTIQGTTGTTGTTGTLGRTP